jgi:S-adenosylmethionine:diacylglycerol 3-amino-3-carboxypropyl transferase
MSAAAPSRRGFFDLVYRTNLVYNQCWEDPALDQEALTLGPGDRVLAITSAGLQRAGLRAAPAHGCWPSTRTRARTTCWS